MEENGVRNHYSPGRQFRQMVPDTGFFPHDEFERQRTVVCSLPATVEREGVLLYAA
jgi:hypothetical protein